MPNAVFRRKFIALNVSQLSTQLKKLGERSTEIKLRQAERSN